MRKNLIYTVAFDQEGHPYHRQLVRFLIATLLRTRWSGDIMVFRNHEQPIFPNKLGINEVLVPRKGLTESEHIEDAWCWKYRVREYIDASQYDMIMFLDDDCMALRNLDHLLDVRREVDVLYQTENLPIWKGQFSAFLTDDEMKMRRKGINSGQLAVRGSVFQDVMTAWEERDTAEVTQMPGCFDQASWNRLILDCDYGKLPWNAKHFERGEVRFPLHCDPAWSEYTKGALVHTMGVGSDRKLQFSLGLYTSTFFYDNSMSLFNILEV
jgi:hypothetical protein